MRIVADTNIVVSGFLFGGVPLRVLNAGKLGIIELCTSQTLLDEFAEVIERPHFDRKFDETGISRRRMVSDYAAISTVVTTTRIGDKYLATLTTMKSSPAQSPPIVSSSSPEIKTYWC